MRTASLRIRTRRSRRSPMPAAQRAELLAEIRVHKLKLQDQWARLQAAERLVVELARLEGERP
jgi:hypothetical protein